MRWPSKEKKISYRIINSGFVLAGRTVQTSSQCPTWDRGSANHQPRIGHQGDFLYLSLSLIFSVSLPSLSVSLSLSPLSLIRSPSFPAIYLFNNLSSSFTSLLSRLKSARTYISTILNKLFIEFASLLRMYYQINITLFPNKALNAMSR